MIKCLFSLDKDDFYRCSLSCSCTSESGKIKLKAGFHMSHFIVSHRISSEFRVYDQLGLIPIYENQPNRMKTRYPNSS